MRFVIQGSCIALLVLVAMATSTPIDQKPIYNIEDAPALFEKFIKDFNKEYSDAADKQVHYEEFVKTLKEINQLNSDPNQGSAVFDINHFSDFTEEQRKQMHGLAEF